MPSSNRGRFLLSRRSQNRANKQSAQGKAPKTNLGRSGPQLSPLRENVLSRPHLSVKKQQRHVSFEPRSTTPVAKIASDEYMVSTGFSKAEIHDLEESFRMFDIYGEGSVQVGDLRGILEVLQQEQEEQQSEGPKYPHLETLLDRLSEVSDEETLAIDDYIQLMASTTISNSILIENANSADETGSKAKDAHFARVFQLFDADGKGYITLKDLERIAVELGEHDMTRGELHEMIDRALGPNYDESGKGEKKVGIDEFTRMMTMNLFSSTDTEGM